MTPRLPSLTALRAFEAAARHMSFAAAAEELSVTPAALSFQIKSLEETLGAPLFVRLARAVELTPAGRALAPDATRGFDALRSGWKAAHTTLSSNRVTIAADPALTAKWLVPALGGFASAHPEIELRIVATLGRVDFARDAIDLAVRFGAASDDGLVAEPLFDECLLPVARPDIAQRLNAPAAVLAETLIVQESPAAAKAGLGWPQWLTLAGIALPEELPVISLAGPDRVVDAALAGQGVALARLSMARHALSSGGLIAPFVLGLAHTCHFRLVSQSAESERVAVGALRAFIRAEAQRDSVLPEGFSITAND